MADILQTLLSNEFPEKELVYDITWTNVSQVIQWVNFRNHIKKITKQSRLFLLWKISWKNFMVHHLLQFILVILQTFLLVDHTGAFTFLLKIVFKSYIKIPVINPDRKVHGANLGPVGPRWAPCWPHEPCYQGTFTLIHTKSMNFVLFTAFRFSYFIIFLALTSSVQFNYNTDYKT